MKRIVCIIAVLALTACTQTKPAKVRSPAPSQTPQSLMLNVAKQVQACWFKKKDPAFTKFKMATELDSYSGKPRILIVPRNNPGGLPKLVAQAEKRSGRTQFSSFGPLLQTSNGPRINASLRAWSRGSKTC